MSKVFKTRAQDAARPVTPYEHSVLESNTIDDDLPLDPRAAREHVIAEARREAEEKVREAYAEGYRRGTEAARADFNGAVSESAKALRAAAEAVQSAREEFLESMEPELVKLSAGIAQRILHREAETDRELVVRTARTAIRHLLDREVIVLRVNPLDLQAMREEKLRLVEEFDGVATIRVEPDEAVLPGGCVADSPTMQVDAGIDAQLESILDGLKGVNGRNRAPGRAE